MQHTMRHKKKEKSKPKEKSSISYFERNNTQVSSFLPKIIRALFVAHQQLIVFGSSTVGGGRIRGRHGNICVRSHGSSDSSCRNGPEIFRTWTPWPFRIWDTWFYLPHG